MLAALPLAEPLVNSSLRQEQLPYLPHSSSLSQRAPESVLHVLGTSLCPSEATPPTPVSAAGNNPEIMR